MRLLCWLGAHACIRGACEEGVVVWVHGCLWLRELGHDVRCGWVGGARKLSCRAACWCCLAQATPCFRMCCSHRRCSRVLEARFVSVGQSVSPEQATAKPSTQFPTMWPSLQRGLYHVLCCTALKSCLWLTMFQVMPGSGFCICVSELYM